MKSKVARALPRYGEFIKTMQPMYADFQELMDAHGGQTFSEIKYDGYRVQVHKSGRGTKIFTRNGNELNYACYPDVMGIVGRLPKGIFEAELVATGGTHKEVFDKVKQRFRRPGIKQASVDKYLASGMVEDVPLHLRVFDTIRFEKRGVLHLPLRERREYTQSVDEQGIVPSEIEVVNGVQELADLVQLTFDAKHEGRVCKNPNSVYTPGGKTIDWVKFKRSEPLDLVVVGLYKGDFRDDLPFTSVLCATYNDETGMYETIGRIGATRNELAADIAKEIVGKVSYDQPSNLVLSDKLTRAAYGHHIPDRYVNPDESVVLEVKAMNLNRSANWQSCGLEDGKAFSMRIGFAQNVRYDKSPRQATTTNAVRKLYELQENGGAK